MSRAAFSFFLPMLLAQRARGCVVRQIPVCNSNTPTSSDASTFRPRAARPVSLALRLLVTRPAFPRSKVHLASAPPSVSPPRRGDHIAWWSSDRHGRRAAGRQRCPRPRLGGLLCSFAGGRAEQTLRHRLGRRASAECAKSPDRL